MVILVLSGTLNWSHKVLKSLLALEFMLCIWIKPLGNATHRDFANMASPWKPYLQEDT